MWKDDRSGWIFLLAGLLLVACQPETEQEATAPPMALTGDFEVVVEGAGLHREAGPEAPQVTTLPAGTQLSDLGGVSAFTTTVVLGGEPLDLPWMQVRRVDNGQEGWIYAGMVASTAADPAATARLREEKTLLAIFGADRCAGIDTYRETFKAVKDAEATAATYRQGLALREQLVTRLEKYLENYRAELPDLFWLERVVPGFMPQLAAEGTTYYLFADYRQWRQLASRTSDRADDDFFELCLHIFPEDSIEYFFPAWTIQTWDYGGHSLLGEGIHRNLLRQLDRTARRSSLFAPEVDRFKTDLLNDILRPHITYWEPQDSIVGEVERILADSLPLLTAPEQVALQTRLEQFRQAEAYGIKTNQRAGE